MALCFDLLWDPVPTTVTQSMVGIALFLLPPVLGMPFYLAFVVVLVAQNQRKGQDTFGIDLVITVVLGMVIKLLAVALQQNGSPFLESVAIKKKTGVRTSVMMCVHFLLDSTMQSCGLIRYSISRIIYGFFPLNVGLHTI
mmetsp:Transcript_25122/g.57765  ORF Transcript_25122/g.57765 Transcript_25122/m.57765 type:complete len:140 (-) Transcript_25122:3-422(-)